MPAACFTDYSNQARNPRPERCVEDALAEVRQPGEAVRRFEVFRYRTLSSRSCERRVVARVEWRTGRRKKHTRFVVTSLSRKRFNTHHHSDAVRSLIDL